MNQIASINSAERPVTPEQASGVIRRLTASLQSPEGLAPSTELRAALERVQAPADPAWVLIRVAALLHHGFDRGTDQRMVEVMATDWAREMAPYPQWAIENACAWWISLHNPKVGKRPMPGEISALAHREMDAIRAANIQLERAPRTVRPEPARPAPTPEDMARRREFAANLIREQFPSHRSA